MAILVLSWVPVLLGTEAIATAGELYPVIETGNSYLVLQHAPLLYVWIPAVVLSSFSLVMSPGLLVVLALRARVDLDRWVVYGFGLSVVLISVLAAVAQALMGVPLTGARFVGLIAGSALAAFGVLEFRQRREPATWPAMPAWSWRQVGTFIAPPLILLVVLLPKFLWDNFTGDGGHGYETTRILLFRALPFWDQEVGNLANFPGLTTMLFTYPASWFLRLFGEFEASVRIPFLLYLTALYAGLMSIARFNRGSPTLADRWLLWLGLTVFTVVMVFSDTYSPYNADIALPAAQNVLLVTCFVGLVAAFVRREHGWMALFLALTMLTQASWILLIGLWLAAVLATWRPAPRRTLVLATSLALLGFLVLLLIPRFLESLGLHGPGGEHRGGELLEQLRYLRLTHWKRFVFLIVPGGIFPALYLLAWKRQDRIARSLTLISLGCFFFFYVQAFGALHYFVPAMVLPLAVLWRAEPTFLRAKRVRVAVCALGVAAAVVSIPENPAPYLQPSVLGRAILDRRPGYEAHDPEFFRQLRIYRNLFPRSAARGVPDDLYGGSPHVWNYYAQRFRDAAKASSNYVLQTDTLPAPTGMKRVGSEAGASLYLASDSVWQAHRTHRAPTSIARLYALPKNILFPFAGAQDPEVIDLAALWRRLTQ
jgi:hypothetical protein